jgi:hypothetical protein
MGLCGKTAGNKPRGVSWPKPAAQGEEIRWRPLNKDVIQKGRSYDRDHGPQKEEKRAGLMEVCLISPQCSKSHKPSLRQVQGLVSAALAVGDSGKGTMLALSAPQQP